jgi:hypothetical protein
MSTTDLLKPILTGGIRSVNFFNGRLLSGEDMSREQEANRDAHKMLGQAIGDGIAYGLEVSRALGAGTSAIVNVQPGLAVNRNGDTLRLSGAVDLSLVRPQNGGGTVVDAGFSSCTPFQSGVYVAGSGVYLLTACPARANEGRAAVSGLQNAAADCNTKYLVDGIQFRLIQLDVTTGELNDQNHLRNLVAYKCFSAADDNSFVTDPFGTSSQRHGMLDDLRPDRLTDCDVPLAVLFWTAGGGINFIDLWSVRRRITPPSIVDRWNLFIGDRRVSEAEARFLQFADQIQDIRLNETNLELIIATDRFTQLPPVGVLPVGARSSRGFDYRRFFQNETYHEPVFVEDAQVQSLIFESFRCPPIEPGSRELIWLYNVRTNRQTIDNAGRSALQAYLVFATGHLPYRGNARFDVNRWNYSNYSQRSAQL